ncbi:MAG: saccharopine dehydrogenase-like oxidoreductase, partial [Firmicutes bacterium]|nr:saccharopine dehydrogenase-like oxidoreductase [Bacillota bacterium]
WFLYTMASHAASRRDMQANVTVWQAGIPSVVATQLILEGEIALTGAIVPEQLDPVPWLARLPKWGMEIFVRESTVYPLVS